MNKNILLYTIMFGLSLSLLACESRIIPRDVYLRNAKKHMEKRYKEEFDEPYIYDENMAMISPITDDTINIAISYDDWDGDGDDEWRDNYMMYKFRPIMYEDVDRILREIYDEYKFHINIDNGTIPNVVTKEEVYKMGVYTYIYTNKNISDKDNEINSLIERILDSGLYTYVSVNYVNDEEFSYASDATAGKINQYKLYNAKKEFLISKKRIKEYDWEYGNLEEE